MGERHILTIRELLAKYGEEGEPQFGRYSETDRNLVYALYRKGEDYLLVTSDGEEYPLKLETLDKVRDICCGNMRGLEDYELKMLEKFSSEWFLESLSKESMRRFYEKETGYKIDRLGFFLFDSIFSAYITRGGMLLSGDEDERKKSIKMAEENIKKEFGVDIKLKSTSDIFSQMTVKRASDISFERKEFLRRVLKKKK